MNVLIVEDHVAIAEIYIKILEQAGYQVEWAKTPDEAIEFCKHTTYDILLVDLMLPNMSGDELIYAIRTLTNNISNPIIVTTNMGSGYNKQSLRDLGVEEFLLKVDAGPTEILETIDKYVHV